MPSLIISAGIEAQEIDTFADIDIGFSPVLTDFVDHHGGEFIALGLGDIGGLEHILGALLGGCRAPSGKGLVRGRDGRLGLGATGAPHVPDDLGGGSGGVGGSDLALGNDVLAVDIERVNAPNSDLTLSSAFYHLLHKLRLGIIALCYILKRRKG